MRTSCRIIFELNVNGLKKQVEVSPYSVEILDSLADFQRKGRYRADERRNVARVIHHLEIYKTANNLKWDALEHYAMGRIKDAFPMSLTYSEMSRLVGNASDIKGYLDVVAPAIGRAMSDMVRRRHDMGGAMSFWSTLTSKTSLMTEAIIRSYITARLERFEGLADLLYAEIDRDFLFRGLNADFSWERKAVLCEILDQLGRTAFDYARAISHSLDLVKGCRQNHLRVLPIVIMFMDHGIQSAVHGDEDLDDLIDNFVHELQNYAFNQAPEVILDILNSLVQRVVDDHAEEEPFVRLIVELMQTISFVDENSRQVCLSKNHAEMFWDRVRNYSSFGHRDAGSIISKILQKLIFTAQSSGIEVFKRREALEWYEWLSPGLPQYLHCTLDHVEDDPQEKSSSGAVVPCKRTRQESEK